MMRREHGFSLIEVLIAATILIVGILSALAAMDSSRRLTLVAERQTSMAHRAAAELERVKALPYNEIGLTGTSSSWASSLSSFTGVSAPTGSCPGAGSPPTYQPDHSSGGSTATEALVIDGCSYTVGGSTSAYATGTVTPVTSWSDGRFSGFIYDFITYTTDPTCGSYCPASNDYKRITVVVTLTGAAHPSNPSIVSAFVADPSLNSPQNILKNVSTYCTQGTQSGSCSQTPPGTPLPIVPHDCSYSSSTCTPSCTGNTLDQTLGILLPANPDSADSNLPTGTCTTPPCYGTDVLTGCQGLPINPSGNSTCGTGPPLDNTKSHAWVGPSIPTGTSVNLTGAGAMTTFLESTTAANVSVTLCLRLYVVPNVSLGVLNNLLSTPISAVISASATATAGVPSPVTFNFPSTAITAGTAISATTGPVRVEFVVWIAGSTTPVEMVYDQAQYSSELTLMTQ